MKRIVKHPEPNENDVVGPKYWRSLDEMADRPEFNQWLEREFPAGAAEADENDRRQFLKIMGASMGLAGFGMAGCRMPTNYVLPYSKQPERLIPGVPIYYASSQPAAKDSIPLVVETHDARPTKIEGNPSYKGYGGSTDSFAQASVLDLYDPDRAKASLSEKSKLTKGAAIDVFVSTYKKYAAKKGAGLAILAEQSSSPTRNRLIAELKKKMPNAIWAEYEPVNTDNPEKALASVFGKNVRPVYQLEKADRVLSFDSDFLHTEPGHLKYTRDFAKARKVNDASEAAYMNRLYAVESNFSLTGGMADHRLRASTSHIPAVVAAFGAEVLKLAGSAQDLVSALEKKAGSIQVDKKWIAECAKDLFEQKGKSVVIAGSHLSQEVQIIAAAINEALGADGKTVNYLELPKSSVASIADVAEAVNAGKVDDLVIIGGNPVYNAPSDLKWADVQKKVSNVIRFGYYEDETAEHANTFIAANHYLESWGDGTTFDGAYLPVQPMILPLFDGVGEMEAIAHLAGLTVEDAQGYDLVRATFDGLISSSDKNMTFNTWLTEGVEKTLFPSISLGKKLLGAAVTAAASLKIGAAALSKDNLEFRIVPSTHTFDGRYNNNGWMMECPDPMNKLTWDNAICISPKLAKELDVLPTPIQMDKLGQLRMNANTFEGGREIAKIAELTVGGETVKGAIHIQPGLADYTVVLALGFGRTKTGRVGTDTHLSQVPTGHGYTAYPFVTTASPAVAVGKLSVTEDTFQLANTQEHWSMEGRAIIREANNTDYAAHPEFVDKMGMESHSPPIYGINKDDSLQKTSRETPRGGSAYETPDFTDAQQWGMNIDLNTCTGCNACVVACQSENNIPIVGKDQVLRGREMHWIRLDRYYSSATEDTTELPSDPQVSFMGVACAQCELAPCESVCPVNATVHDEQGLNTMAYNRCVGTRYCANNCPYKVRRFNFFDYNKRDLDDLYKGPLGKKNDVSTIQMQKNPDVTVRMRGVMEKCTYCVQRIEEAKINQRIVAKDSGNVNVPDGTIKTACQQVCPAEAITFGDIADENTEVSKAKENDRDYSLLGYLNIRPRTTYSAKLRNPNPMMPDYNKQPLSRVEYETRYGHGGGDHGDHGSHSDKDHAAH